ncbi:hypothetical protein Asp14428_12530 [Actinoplanes sp. NBRC 14428]|nr:hypothetical protein Asp14428_12530 [Actinoplanes sp. NBRC 14428]
MVTSATLLRSTYRSDDRDHRLGEFRSYAEAERMVDRLSDAGFPVERVRIVGVGLHSVEQVMGRLTAARSALIGGALGAWLGLLTGLVIGLLIADAAWLAHSMGGLLAGAVAGAGIGLLTHWSGGGRRDFASTTGIQAERYAVEVAGTHAAVALRALDR